MRLSDLSIKTRITVLTGLCVIGVVTAIVYASVIKIQSMSDVIERSSSKELKKQAIDHLSKVGEAEAGTISRRFSESTIFLETLGRQIMSARKQSLESSEDSTVLRQKIFNMILDQVSANPNVFGVGVTFEPNAFDGRDKDFISKSLQTGNEIGRYAFYASPQSKNNTVPESEIIDNGLPGTYWYSCPIKEKRLCVVDPYTYTNPAGTATLMTTISTPLFDGDNLVGVIGLDLALSSFQSLAQKASDDLYKGAAKVTFVSSEGSVAARSNEANLLGTSLKQIEPEVSKEMSSNLKSSNVTVLDNGSEISVIFPFLPVQGAKNWSVFIQVPTNVLLASVYELKEKLSEMKLASTINLLVVGCIAGLIGLLLIWFMSFTVTRPILQVAEMLAGIASGDGDLTKRLSYEGRDEVGLLAGWFNKFLDKLQPIIIEIGDSIRDTRLTAGQASDIANETSKGMQEQFKEVDQVATASQEMSATSQDVARNASLAADAARNVDRAAQAGMDTIVRTTQSINTLATQMKNVMVDVNHLEKNSEKIGNVLEVIRSVAEQTNLLALNAAIEAARAGESGRGFAVVADEVRNLARRTQDSVVEIQEVIETLQIRTKNVIKSIQASHVQADGSVLQVDQAVESLHAINEAVEVIRLMNLQIASAAEEQSAVSEEVNRNVSTIRDVTEMLTRRSEDSASVSDTLNKLANKQQALINNFRV